MLRSSLYVFIICGCCLFSCKNNPTSSTTNPAGLTRQDSVLAEPDAADLLQTLQGKWQSEQDSTYQLEILGDKMSHYNAGRLSLESQIEIDGNCLSNACKVDSIETANGWCFVEKGQYDAQCNLVLKCDKQTLQYRALGAASPTLIFKKK